MKKKPHILSCFLILLLMMGCGKEIEISREDRKPTINVSAADVHPKLSEEEATEIARRFLQQICREKAKGEPKELFLVRRDPIGYFIDTLTEEEKEKAKELFGGYVKKGYRVDYHVWFGGTIVYVDANDGSIADGDFYVSDDYDDADEFASDE